MPEYAAACFDLDGTLIDTEPVHLAAETACLDALGIGRNSHRHQRTFGIGIEAGLASLAETYGLDYELVLRTYMPLWESGVQRDIQTLPGATEVLSWLDRHDIPAALVTSCGRAYVDLVGSALGIIDGFGAVVTSDDVGSLKPDPEPYLMAAERLGVRPEACIGFEDSGSGVASLSSAGMLSILVHIDHASRPETQTADICLNSLDEALPLLAPWFP